MRIAELAKKYNVTNDELIPEARALAVRLTAGAPLAQRAMKEVATRTRTMPSLEAIRFGETMRLVAAATDDAREGGAAARDRRPPVWSGR